MNGNNDRSILTRPPKWPPTVSLALGLVCIPHGALIQGLPGGILVGVGIGTLVTAAWDFSRLRFVAWRRGRAQRGGVPREGRA